MLKKIKDITPIFPGYGKYPKDEDGKIILPRKKIDVLGHKRDVIIIYRKNVIEFGNGLIGLLDGSKIRPEDWVDLRKCFLLIDDDGKEHFHWSVGGSDAGVCKGESPYSNIALLYDTKTSAEPEQHDPATEFRFAYGHINEELIARAFATRIKNGEVVKDNTVFFNVDIGFMQANIDFMVKYHDGSIDILEIKTVNSANQSAIAAYADGEVPNHYYSQAVCHYPRVLGKCFNIRGTFFAVGYNNNLADIKIIHFPRDPEGEILTVEKEAEFVSYLKEGVKPTCEVTSQNVSMYKAKMSKVAAIEGSTLSESEIDDELIALSEAFLVQQDVVKMVKSQLKAAETDLDVIKVKIQEKLGTAEKTPQFHLSGVYEGDYYAGFTTRTRTSANLDVLQHKYLEVFDDVKQTTSYQVFGVKKVKNKKK